MKKLLSLSAIAASVSLAGLGTPAVKAQETVQNYLDEIENYAGGQYPGVAADPATSELQLLEQIESYSTSASSLGQAYGANQFSDVSPGDWAYQALHDFVRRYGCLKGYPDGTFRGNRTMTRYEFAAALKVCMQGMERMSISPARLPLEDEKYIIQRLMQDFEAELAALGARIDALESRTAFLEDNQFSTTTKLGGEVIFGLSQLFTNSDPVDLAFLTNNGQDAIAAIDNNDTNKVFGYRARLTFNTSFTGQDLLVTRLATGNLSPLTANTLNLGTTTFVGGDATQTFNVGANSDTVAVDWLAYYFPFGNAQGYVAANGGIWSDFVPTLNPYFEDFDGGNGALSTFASENPIYRIGGGAGAGVSWNFGGPRLSLGYLAGQANASNRGLLSGDYALLAQVDAEITTGLQLGLTYVHGYHPTNTNIFDAGSTGTRGLVGTASATLASGPSITNSYGAELAWQLNEDISFSSFISYTDIRETSFGNTFDGEVWTYGLGLAFPDLGREGNLLGLFVGAQPYLGSFDSAGAGTVIRRTTTPYHVEAFYKHRINDHISITPGIIWLSAPNQVRESAIIGTIRTTFMF